MVTYLLSPEELLLNLGRKVLDVTPFPHFDYQYTCLMCDTVSFSYAYSSEPQFREGAPIPEGYLSVALLGDELYTVPACPRCLSTELEVTRIGGPFPTRRHYVQIGPPRVEGEFRLLEYLDIVGKVVDIGFPVLVTWAEGTSKGVRYGFVSARDF